MSPLILNDGHRHYRLHLPGDRSLDRAFEPLRFHDPLFAQTFVRGLRRGISRVESDQWRRLLHDVDGVSRYLREQEIYEAVAALIVRGRIQVYLIAHLSHRGHAASYLTLPAGGGMQYRFIPASLLLVNDLRDVRLFRDNDTAATFIHALNLTDAHIEAIMTAHAPTADGSARSSARLTAMLIEALANGEMALQKELISSASVKNAPVEFLPANGPGNRPTTLGPHVGSAHTANPPPIANTTNPVKKVSQPRMPTTKNKNIDHSRTMKNPDGSTTYYDHKGRNVTYSKERYPDFSPYSEAEVKVNGLKGAIPPDDTIANKAVGLKSTPDDFTWHHVEDGKTMQLVPTDIHSTFQHTGGGSKLRAAI
jgi:hypothetical protein